MIRAFTLLLLLLCCGSLLLADDSEDDRETVSPKESFKIVQHRDGNWNEALHFTNGKYPDIILEKGISWPALFYISPDDQWILRVQKSGSGDNISFLYRIKPNGRLWGMDRSFSELALNFLKHSSGISRSDFYHTGIEFGDWNLATGILSFTIHGSSIKRSGEGFEEALIYDLKKDKFSAP